MGTLVLGSSVLLLLFTSIASGIVMIVGGLKMLRLQSYGWSLAACIIALLPFNPVGILGLIVGAWGLVVLNQPNIRAAFQGGVSPPARGRSGETQTWLWWVVIAAICLALICLIPLGVIPLWRLAGGRSANMQKPDDYGGAGPASLSPETGELIGPATELRSTPPDQVPDRVRLEQVGHLAVVGDNDPFLSLAVQGKYAYLIQGNVEKPKRLHVVDLSDPALPRIVGSMPVTVQANRLAVSGQHVCVLDEPHFRVVDVSKPAEPREVGSCELGELLWDVAIQGRYAYVTDVESLRVIDLENPAAPQQVGRCDLVTAQGVYVSGKYAYVACDIEGLYVLDISDPKQPQVIGEFEQPQGAADVVEVGQYAYVVGGEDAVTLWIADVSNPRRPREVGQFGDWIQGSIAVLGNYAFLAGGDLDIIDISNRDAPMQAGSYPNAAEIVATDGLLYVVNDAGLEILRVVRAATGGTSSAKE